MLVTEDNLTEFPIPCKITSYLTANKFEWIIERYASVKKGVLCKTPWLKHYLNNCFAHKLIIIKYY